MNRVPTIAVLLSAVLLAGAGCGDDKTSSGESFDEWLQKHSTDSTSAADDTATASDQGTDTEAPPSDGADTDTGADSAAADTNTGAEQTEPPVPQVVHIEAECAFGYTIGDCDSLYPGSNSELPPDTVSWGASQYPQDDESGGATVAAYFCQGSWIAFADVPVDGVTQVVVRASGISTDSGFLIRLDSPDAAPVAVIKLGQASSWDTYAEYTVDLPSPLQGTHTVYITAEPPDENTGAGNIDWIEFHR